MDVLARKPLRVWPGVVILILQLLLRFVLPVVMPDAFLYGLLGGLVCTGLVVLWWLFLSRAAWIERLGAVALMVGAMFAARPFLDKSIVTGAQGMLFVILAVPLLGGLFVVWAVVTRRLPDGIRRATMVATILLACGGWTLVKTGGFTASSFRNDLHFRWAKSAEERLVSRSGNEPGALPAAPAAPAIPEQPPSAPPVQVTPPKPEKRLATEASVHEAAPVPPVAMAPEAGVVWPGFRGPHRDDIVSGVRIKTDWTASPPVAMWRRPIGPGWSSFAARGGFIYTQEQRGPDEVVSCYRLATGEPVWAHRDAARFWESNGGPGPRGTPTLSGSRVYTFGATGIVNVLNAADGTVVWSRNAASDTGMKRPQWGFASSPLVTGGLVVVGVAGQFAAYDEATGSPRWTGPAHGVSYSSPQLATIDGVQQVLLLSEAGLTSVALADGKVLWEHPWPGYPIVQPSLTVDGDVLISVTDSSGIRRLAIAHEAGGWTATERWTSYGLKPYFNDFVVHKGYAYGFDGSILSCITLQDGQRKWKGGRYGNGQLLLLADQDLLLLSSEEGELALVRAVPDQFTELARFPGIEGKTWNHPVLAGDVLLVRNGQEMAAFRLATAGG